MTKGLIAVAGFIIEVYLGSVITDTLLNSASDSSAKTILIVGLCAVGMIGTAIFLLRLLFGSHKY